MNERQLTTVLGLTIAGLVYQNMKLNHTRRVTQKFMNAVGKYIELDIQEKVDTRFKDIVQNFDK